MHLLRGQLGNEFLGFVDVPESFEDALRVDADGAAAFVLFDIPVLIRELLNVAVEIDAAELGLCVDDGRTRVAADRVRRIDEIQGRRHIEFAHLVFVPLRKIERRHLAKAKSAVIQAEERRVVRHERRVLVVAFYTSVTQPKIEVGVRWNSLAIDGESSF